MNGRTGTTLSAGDVVRVKDSTKSERRGNHVKSDERRPRVGKEAAARTPLPFRDVLLAMARSASVTSEAVA